jgi:hypothetical protein
MGLRCSLGLALASAAAALTASCTLLVQFHDAPGGGCEGGFCGDDASVLEDSFVPPTADSGVDGAHDAAATGDAGKVEAAVEAGPDHYAPCDDLASGFYCAEDGLHGYAGSPDDLVQCADGGIAKVTLCDGGCLPLPAPFPDACNPCPGNPDGTYCGRNLAGFPAVNADFLIQCQTGNVVQSVACAHGCDSSGTSSSCYP